MGDFDFPIPMLGCDRVILAPLVPVGPGSLGIRTPKLLLIVILGSPVVCVAWAIIFPVLMFLMTYLSIRFSKRNYRMTILNRAALFVASIYLLLATSQLFISGTQNSVLMFSGAGDGALLISGLNSELIR
jgi:hypothetical protein